VILEEVIAENEQLKKQIEEYNAQSTLTYCVFCGAKFPMDDEAGTKVIEHVKTCEKHPLYQANQRIKESEEKVRNVINKMLEPTGFSIGVVFDSSGIIEYMVCDRDGDEMDLDVLKNMMDVYMTPDEE
jgi:ribosomal protein L31